MRPNYRKLRPPPRRPIQTLYSGGGPRPIERQRSEQLGAVASVASRLALLSIGPRARSTGRAGKGPDKCLLLHIRSVRQGSDSFLTRDGGLSSTPPQCSFVHACVLRNNRGDKTYSFVSIWTKHHLRKHEDGFD
ncbi:hypothetical protein SUGI_1226040 [Cryptomeria japonica]|uniref:Uncharacterized protein n=1 Tax=Cryptomeria japonica TaxID=3369 RepID=A0AAD3NPS1_CRYJA|nr:hypothetical protein SUGI_1226040 [Cryptomeria japonica]